jgi:hypothetical protein
MIETNTDTSQLSPVEKGRQFLEKGDISSAVDCYGRVFDPDALDEAEARSMLIEARAHLSRKHLFEVLENFEEALLMGTEVQRRQSLEAITTIGEIWSRLPVLTNILKKGLKERFGKRVPLSVGLVFVSEQENLVLISPDAVERLPGHVIKAGKIRRIPQHLAEQQLPIRTDKCILYTDEEDVSYILEVADHLMKNESPDAGEN